MSCENLFSYTVLSYSVFLLHNTTMQYHTIKINKIYCKNNDYNHVISLNNNVLSVTKRNNEG